MCMHALYNLIIIIISAFLPPTGRQVLLAKINLTSHPRLNGACQVPEREDRRGLPYGENVGWLPCLGVYPADFSLIDSVAGQKEYF